MESLSTTINPILPSPPLNQVPEQFTINLHINADTLCADEYCIPIVVQAWAVDSHILLNMY